MSAARAIATGNKIPKSTKTKHSPKKGPQTQPSIDTFLSRKRKGEEEDRDLFEERSHKSSKASEYTETAQETEMSTPVNDNSTIDMGLPPQIPQDPPSEPSTGSTQFSQIQSLIASSMAAYQADIKLTIEATVKATIEETVKSSLSAQLAPISQGLKSHETQIAELSQKISALEQQAEVNKLNGGADPEAINSLKRTILQLQIDARANNLILYGLEEKKIETTEYLRRKIIEIFSTYLGCNNLSFDPPTRILSKSRPRPVKICFHIKQQRDSILFRKRTDFPYRIGADLPPEVAKMRGTFNDMVLWANQNRVPYKRTDTFVSLDGKKYDCEQAKKFLKENPINPTNENRGAPRESYTSHPPGKRGPPPPRFESRYDPHGHRAQQSSSQGNHDRSNSAGARYEERNRFSPGNSGRPNYSQNESGRFSSSQNNFFSQGDSDRRNFSQNHFSLGNTGSLNFSQNNSLFPSPACSTDQFTSHMEA